MAASGPRRKAVPNPPVLAPSVSAAAAAAPRPPITPTAAITRTETASATPRQQREQADASRVRGVGLERPAVPAGFGALRRHSVLASPAPTMGTWRIGARRPERAQKACARSRAGDMATLRGAASTPARNGAAQRARPGEAVQPPGLSSIARVRAANSA